MALFDRSWHCSITAAIGIDRTSQTLWFDAIDPDRTWLVAEFPCSGLPARYGCQSVQNEVLNQFTSTTCLEPLHGVATHMGAPKLFTFPRLHENQDARIFQRLEQFVVDATRFLQSLCH